LCGKKSEPLIFWIEWISWMDYSGLAYKIFVLLLSDFRERAPSQQKRPWMYKESKRENGGLGVRAMKTKI
jgi:hypothetical protein